MVAAISMSLCSMAGVSFKLVSFIIELIYFSQLLFPARWWTDAVPTFSACQLHGETEDTEIPSPKA